MRDFLISRIQHHFPGAVFDVLKPPQPELGDYSVNLAFALAQQSRRNPFEAAQSVSAALIEDAELAKIFERIEPAQPGFVNFFLKPAFLQRQLLRMAKEGKRYGSGRSGKGKRVIVEYSSPNIAKPMHVGHLRSTVIGDALANILAFTGYRVVRWNYVGDWGTQFGKLIAAYKRWGIKAEVQKQPIATLLDLYVRFHEELKEHPELEKEGQDEFKKLEKGDRANRGLWRWFREESFKDFNRIYALLGVKFNVMDDESNYEKDIRPLIDFLGEQGLVKESEGALVFDLGAYGLPPALVQKADGASLYFTREIVTLQKRVDKYNPAKILYVVGNEQALHFQQLFAAAKPLGLDTAELVHVKYGLVLGSDRQKLSTREGNAVQLDEVIQKGIELARTVAERKNPSLSEQERSAVAQAVGIGALKYNDLKEYRTSDIVFDWDRMLDLTGNSAPYLQYTYARLASIVRKTQPSFLARLVRRPEVGALTEKSELDLLHHLVDFPDAVADSARDYATNNLALYLYELANRANRFYESVRVAEDADAGRRYARVALVGTVAAVLRTGLSLLGITTPERI